MKNKISKRSLLEALVIGFLIFFLTITVPLPSFDYLLKDFFYQQPRGVDSNIKIIAIDDKTLETLGPVNTWSRQTYADLLDNLYGEDVSPAVVAFDILFQGYVDDGDFAFAKKAEECGNIVLVSQFLYEERPYYDESGLMVFRPKSLAQPFAEIRDVTYTGFANISQDNDKIVRRAKLNEEYEELSIDMFSKVIYDTYCENTGLTKSEVPRDKYGRLLINYSGKPGDYEAISLVDVLEGKIDKRAFMDSIVLVGAYASGMQDNFNVPISRAGQMYGVEIHANIVQSFLQGRFAVAGDPYQAAILLGICGIILFLLFKLFKVYFAFVLLVVSIAAEFMGGVYLNNKGTSYSLLYFPLVMAIGFIYMVVTEYILELYRKRQVINAFKKYVAPQVVEEISKTGEFKVDLGGAERDIAVLFVDIRGFTTMSEVLSPAEVVAILNEYLALTTEAIFNNKGTLDKFVGDCTMAVFNSPFDLDDYEYRAVCAALDIVNGGEKLTKKLLEKHGRTIGFGVGVHCGKAVVGNIGCDVRMDFTAIGDTVNTAARLEANAPAGQVYISEDLYERIGDRIHTTLLDNPPKLKGKSNTFKIYSVTGLKNE